MASKREIQGMGQFNDLEVLKQKNKVEKPNDKTLTGKNGDLELLSTGKKGRKNSLKVDINSGKDKVDDILEL